MPESGIRFVPSSNLVVLRENQIDMNIIQEWEHYHEIFPDQIWYIEEESGRLKGIFSVREQKKSILLGRPVWNATFFRFDEQAVSDEGYLKQFHTHRPNFLNVPYVKGGILQGEYIFQRHQPIMEYMQWSLLKESVKRFMRDNSVGSISCIGEDECSRRLKAVLEEVGIGTSEMSDYRILGYEICYLRYRSYLTGETTYLWRENEIPIYDFYMHCLIGHCLRQFQAHQVGFWYFEGPKAEQFHDINERDKELLLNPQSPHDIAANKNLLDEVCMTEQDRHYIKALEWTKNQFIERDGYFGPLDYAGEGLSIINGRRKTCFVSENIHRRIFVFGICTAGGWYTPDDGTVESLLQLRLNECCDTFEVINCGAAEGILGAALNDFQYILHTTFHDGDIVCCISDYSKRWQSVIEKNGGNIVRLSPALERKRCGRWFLDLMFHTNRRGNDIIAETIYEVLGRAGTLEDAEESGASFRLFHTAGEGGLAALTDYLDQAKALCPELFEPNGGRKIGAIVMNCNPFTYGHRYLVEEARKYVDRLILFVVEEDRSEFSFAERLEMVKWGTSDLDGVYVLPSGKLIISQDTFPEYFEKEHLQSRFVDTSRDLYTFVEQICPAFRITDRFVGEEPFDRVTENYNRTMERILRECGIGFHELPRKKARNRPVSASYVRQLMSDGQWEELTEYVPKSTFAVLKKHMEEQKRAPERTDRYEGI